jgi:hypothetical protein
MIIGGATPKKGATDPFDPASYQAFSNVLLQYDINLRAVGDLSATYNAFLKEGRAFHASALGNNGLVAIVGGYTMDENKKPKLTRSIEFFDPATKQIRTSMVTDSNPNDDIDPNRLLFARTGHTVTRMFDQDNYFIIVGGRGDKPDAARTWEIWHPVNGIQAQGLLSRPRWNHTAIRLPEADGGFVMLVGGEGLDEQGKPMVHNTFEVLRYDTLGHVSRMGNKLVTCKFAGKNYNQPPGGPFGYDKCAALKGQPGHLTILWTPEVYPLLESVGRTMPGVLYVPHGSYHYIYVIGGFADAARTKPMDRIDIFNIGTGGWVPNSLKLETARGAPQITASMVGSRRGQVLVVGGIDAIGRSISKAEVVYYPHCRTTKECRDYGWCTNFNPKAQCVAASEADCVASTGCKQFGWCALVGGRCISAVGANPAPPQLGSSLQQWTAKNSLLGGTVLGLAVPLSTGHILIAGGTQAGSNSPLVANGSLHLWNPL